MILLYIHVCAVKSNIGHLSLTFEHSLMVICILNASYLDHKGGI